MRWDQRPEKPPENIPRQPLPISEASPFVRKSDRDSERIKMDYGIFYRDSKTEARKKVSELTSVRKEDIIEVADATPVYADDDGYYVQYDVNYAPGRWMKVKVVSFGPKITVTEHKVGNKILDKLNDKRQWVQIT